jgi:hypothetical protein
MGGIIEFETRKQIFQKDLLDMVAPAIFQLYHGDKF